jgi:hypothetical protein
MDGFLEDKFGIESLWDPLRKNYKTEEQFIKACWKKIDALRILQFLKVTHKEGKDEENLRDFVEKNHLDLMRQRGINLAGISFAKSSTEELNDIRNLLFSIEMELRKKVSFVGIY